MTDRLDIAMLHRAAHREKILTRAERHSVDFVVDGVSLFAATRAGALDLCGCFSPDYATWPNELVRDENERMAKIFTFESPPEIERDRVALFICPQCGDLACGAITFRLSRADDTVRWSDFAFENGYDEEQTDFDSYSAIGPFEFAVEDYMAVIRRAVIARPGISR
jgi:hypothetical protein